jgi:glycosyltransferase involved in cell wall biosynthesis
MAAPSQQARKLCYICEATEGGVRKHLRDLLRVFVRPEEGFEISAILGDRDEPGFREELAQLAAARPSFTFTFVPSLRRALCPLNDTRAYRHIKALLRARRPEIIHTHSSKAGFLGRQAAHALGLANVLHTPHVFPFQWTTGLKRRFYLALERHAARLCRTIVCVSESQRADAVAQRLCAPEKLVVVRNGLELPAASTARERSTARAALGIAENTPVVGMVARLAPQKGVGAFIGAAAEILRQRPEVLFLLVGSGPLEGEMRARLAGLRIPPERFRLLGHREDTGALYPAFDVLILSSLYEGLPYVLLEAMACGLPVIATDVLGSRDVVLDGQTGLLARANDSAQIAAQTLKVLNDAELRARLGAAARVRVAEQFSFAAFVAGHRVLYSACVGQSDKAHYAP